MEKDAYTEKEKETEMETETETETETDEYMKAETKEYMKEYTEVETKVGHINLNKMGVEIDMESKWGTPIVVTVVLYG